MNKKMLSWLFLLLVCAFSSVFAKQVVIKMYATENNTAIGTVTAKDSPYGLLFIPNLHDLPPGVHGFHVHVHADCQDHGMAAGGHFDPKNTNKHLGPYNSKGHLGDLPVLIVNPDGTATIPVLAPRLTTKMIQKHTLMIHAGGDNYADTPEKLGGGGARIACGVIP